MVVGMGIVVCLYNLQFVYEQVIIAYEDVFGLVNLVFAAFKG